MVFSDDFLHFLKIKKKNCRIHQNYLVALTTKYKTKYHDLMPVEDLLDFGLLLLLIVCDQQ